MIHADLARVLVTGASRGLGAALARVLVERGGLTLPHDVVVDELTIHPASGDY